MSAYNEFFRPIVLAVMSIMIFSCANQRSTPGNGKIFTYATSACEGSCPVFTITFSENGRAAFQGFQHTRVSGDSTFIFETAETDKLFEILARVDFPAMEDRYLNTLFDLPEVKMTYMGNTIIYNDDRIIPQPLRDLTQEVRRLLNRTGLVE